MEGLLELRPIYRLYDVRAEAASTSRRCSVERRGTSDIQPTSKTPAHMFQYVRSTAASSVMMESALRTMAAWERAYRQRDGAEPYAAVPRSRERA
ncbi:MAG TPA: hypothetical protein PKI40_10000 [Methanomassiliicoccaceae archaeon]|nr:hypothetical protein [Methanomassiliicoccaceae archaeon]HOQ26418.1 hypothetical protein [Methanomassiliicoccaceae archaeon]